MQTLKNIRNYIAHDVLFSTEQGIREQGHVVMYTPDKTFLVVKTQAPQLQLVHPTECIAVL